MLVAFIVSFAIMLAMACVESLRRKTPINYIMLALFTIAESYMVAAFSSKFDPEDVSVYHTNYILSSIIQRVTHTGTNCDRTYYSSLRWTDYIRLPNEMGLHHDGWHFVCGANFVLYLRTGCHVCPRSNYDAGLLVLWSATI